MKIVKIMGGMGNQMFQYAFGVTKGRNVRYDISWFRDTKNSASVTNRDYELGFWKICPKLVSGTKTKKYLFGLIKIKPKKIIERPANIYSEKLFRARRGFFEGYFQVAKYYDAIREKLLSDFVPVQSPNEQNAKMLEKICSTNSVSLHIRRGDYVKHSSLGGVCGMDYYTRAIDYIKTKVKNPHLYIFSDDIEWCVENLNTGIPMTFVNINSGPDCAWDIWLMKRCKHNIIANSSFSWWGAWLNENPEKIVIAPKDWFATGQKTDIIPDLWKKL